MIECDLQSSYSDASITGPFLSIFNSFFLVVYGYAIVLGRCITFNVGPLMKYSLIFALLISVTSLQATTWIGYTPEVNTRIHPVILVGKVSRIEYNKSMLTDTISVNIAYINVSEVLKNEIEDAISIQPGSEIPLYMLSSEAKYERHKFITYKDGTNGIWILSYRDETFRAGHPDALKPLSHLDKIKELITNPISDAEHILKGLNSHKNNEDGIYNHLFVHSFINRFYRF